MIAVSMAPPAPPATACEMMPPMLRLPDCAAAVIAGNNNVTIWPSTPPPIKPEIMLPIIPRSKFGDDLPSANATKRPRNEVDQNLFHVDLPAFQNASSLFRSDPGVEFSVVVCHPANCGRPAKCTTKDMQAAGRALGQQIRILNASTADEIDAAFATLAQQRAGELLIGGDAFFTSRRVQLAILAARYGLPAIYNTREFPAAGGLMSYGGSLSDAYRQTGVYIGKILRGAKPADLPVWQPTKVELVINLRTAKTLGLDVPPSLLARADEVIE